jgi:hypothetical protein
MLVKIDGLYEVNPGSSARGLDMVLKLSKLVRMSFSSHPTQGPLRRSRTLACRAMPPSGFVTKQGEPNYV